MMTDLIIFTKFRAFRRTVQTFKNSGKYNKAGESQTLCSTVAHCLKYIRVL